MDTFNFVTIVFFWKLKYSQNYPPNASQIGGTVHILALLIVSNPPPPPAPSLTTIPIHPSIPSVQPTTTCQPIDLFVCTVSKTDYKASAISVLVVHRCSINIAQCFKRNNDTVVNSSIFPFLWKLKKLLWPVSINFFFLLFFSYRQPWFFCLNFCGKIVKKKIFQYIIFLNSKHWINQMTTVQWSIFFFFIVSQLPKLYNSFVGIWLYLFIREKSYFSSLFFLFFIQFFVIT